MGIVSEVTTKVILTCDGPKCVGKDGKGKTTLTWIDEEVKKDPMAAPDDFWRFLQVGTPRGVVLNFCGTTCLRDALAIYVAPLSPREEAEQDKRNKEVEEKKGGLQLVPKAEPVQKTDAAAELAEILDAKREAAVAGNTVMNDLPPEAPDTETPSAS